MPVTVPESYEYCLSVARTEARNFYFSFMCLPREKHAAMCAVYAFMRHSDAISDDGSGDRARRMERWRTALNAALDGEYGDSKIWPAFHDTVTRYRIPAEYFHAVIDGTRMD